MIGYIAAYTSQCEQCSHELHYQFHTDLGTHWGNGPRNHGQKLWLSTGKILSFFLLLSICTPRACSPTRWRERGPLLALLTRRSLIQDWTGRIHCAALQFKETLLRKLRIQQLSGELPGDYRRALNQPKIDSIAWSVPSPLSARFPNAQCPPDSNRSNRRIVFRPSAAPFILVQKDNYQSLERLAAKIYLLSIFGSAMCY